MIITLGNTLMNLLHSPRLSNTHTLLSEEKMSKEVCVTAGTGFIAGHLIRELLHRGYRVRTTVRDPDNLEKISYLWDLPGAVERLKVVKAALLEEGSFDAAVEGAHGVFHTASPVPLTYDENVQETLIDPAVKGTLNVLKSCSRSKSVKRVVVTSSCTAIRYDYDSQQKSPLNESHWSNPEYCKQYNLWYAYAKTMAEKRSLEVCRAAKIGSGCGKPLIGCWATARFQAYQQSFHSTAHNKRVDCIQMHYKCNPSLQLHGENNRLYPNKRSGFVHIDDVITAHILAMEVPSASGRFICSGDVAHWEEIVEMLRKKYPMYPIADRCGGEEGHAIPHTMDTTKIRSLGLTNFKSIEQAFEDCVRSFQVKGLLQSTDLHKQA